MKKNNTDFLDRLEVIKASDDLVLKIYECTKAFPKSEQFGLISQMRRAAVSVPANIAEGYSRQSRKEKLQFCYISSGSLSELRYMVRLSVKLKYINQREYDTIKVSLEKTGKLLTGLIRYVKKQEN